MRARRSRSRSIPRREADIKSGSKLFASVDDSSKIEERKRYTLDIDKYVTLKVQFNFKMLTNPNNHVLYVEDFIFKMGKVVSYLKG